MSVRPRTILNNNAVGFKPEIQSAMTAASTTVGAESSQLNDIVEKLNSLQSQVMNGISPASSVASNNNQDDAVIKHKPNFTAVGAKASSKSLSLEDMHARLSKIEAVYEDVMQEMKTKIQQVQTHVHSINKGISMHSDTHERVSNLERLHGEYHDRLNEHHDMLNELHEQTAMTPANKACLERIHAKISHIEARNAEKRRVNMSDEHLQSEYEPESIQSSQTHNKRDFQPLASEYSNSSGTSLGKSRDLSGMTHAELQERINKLESLKAKLTSGL